MSAIFLAYHRDDGTIGGRIYERLTMRFGGASVLRESDPLPTGISPLDAMRGVIARCAAVLVVVSPRWLEAAYIQQLADPNNLLHVEIEMALQRGIPVFPLLVEGATLPPAQMLPLGMAALASRNGIPIRDDPDFEGDINQIGAIVANLLPAAPAPMPGPTYYAVPQMPYPVNLAQPAYPVFRPEPGYASAPPTASRSSYKGLFWILGAGLSVLLVVCVIAGVLVINRVHQLSRTSISDRQPVSASVLDAITKISPQTFATVNTGELPNPLQQITPGVPILRDSSGKPIILYVGAEYCPYCASERWSIVVALSRFGTFSNLHTTTSSSTDTFPDTPTFTFYQSSYTSQYLAFQGVEVQDRNQQPLQSMTSAQNTLFVTYDASPYTQSAQSFPFLDFGNQYVAIGAGYLNDVLTNQDWQTIAAALNNPQSPVTQAIVGNANYLTAAICQLTNNQPASVCAAAPIPTIEKTIGKSAGS